MRFPMSTQFTHCVKASTLDCILGRRDGKIPGFRFGAVKAERAGISGRGGAAMPCLCRGYDGWLPALSISYARIRIFPSIRRACWRRRVEERK